jgi:hypothetical protein
VNPHE